MKVVPGQIYVEELKEWVKKSEKHYLVSDVSRDLLHIAVVERHKASERVGKSFVKGFGLRKGAASSVAHDHHNVIVAETDPEDMYAAVRHVEAMGGGFTAVSSSRALAFLPLEFAGLMSVEPVDEVVEN